MQGNGMYIIIDRQTGQRANRTTYKSLRAVLRAVDRLDSAYGAYRYRHQRAESIPMANMRDFDRP